jgi:hypothetical protein
LARSGNGHFLTTNVVDFVFGLILLYFARTCVAFSVRKLLGKMRKYRGRINMTEKRKHEIDFLMAVFILKWTKCTNNLRKHTNICKFVTNEDPCVCVRACVCVWILYIYILLYIIYILYNYIYTYHMYIILIDIYNYILFIIM